MHLGWGAGGWRVPKLCADDSLDVFDAYQHVFRLQICVTLAPSKGECATNDVRTSMNDAALAVHIVKPEENLLRDLLDERHRDTFIL